MAVLYVNQTWIWYEMVDRPCAEEQMACKTAKFRHDGALADIAIKLGVI